MEVNMKGRTRILAVIFAVVAVVFVADWFRSKAGDAVAPDDPVADTGNAKPFEYFPSQFVMKPGEPTGDVPTF
jgi:hypothetical protein